MPEYGEYNTNNRQRDLVLATNEFCFLQSKTNGVIKTYTGPITMTISAQEALVVFDEKTKQFRETADFNEAKQLFTSAPEGWYVTLKNPAPDNSHPEIGKAVSSPELEVGKKINITGPCNFSLFPGQMARVIQGHRLRSNQYLLARVYDADAAEKSKATFVDAEGKKTADTNKYFAGQLLVVKGTDVSFYVPPTGIEVIPIGNDTNKGYVRSAVTLERLEYAILKDENGTKNYVHGPEVVFPKPTETFVTSPKGGVIFKAIELSKISGIYIKVIAEYTDENKVLHPVGEEMFITGADQMIYYPRPEHAIINYDNKIMHHAIAIPEGEGRYIMNRLTGEIKTLRGPAMYLPDPRTEVVVKRKLTPKQCDLWYPGNTEVRTYNNSLSEKSVEKATKKGLDDWTSMSFASAVADSYNSVATSASYLNGFDAVTTMSDIEASASVSRGTSYTKPRTITLDNRFDGVVSIDVWTGYAVDVISKTGERQVICGPQTILLDYDQTLEVLQMSTGRPKSTNNLIKTVYLRHENNKVSDLIAIETKDFVRANIKVSYCVDFDPAYMDSWFNVENYVKYLCDRERSLIKREAKKYTIEEFYQNYSDIVRNIAINAPDPSGESADNRHKGRFFEENGMYVHDCEILSIDVEDTIAELLTDHQYEMVEKSLELSDAEKRVNVAEALALAEQKEQELRSQQLINKMELQRAEALRQMEINSEINRQKELEKAAVKQAERDMQPILDEITKADIARRDAEQAQEIKHKEALLNIEKEKQAAYAETIAKIMASISDDLVAAMSTKSNADILAAVSKAMSPYAIANGESVADTTNRLLRGTPLEGLLEKFAESK